MAIKKGQRLTKSRLKRQYNKAKEATPVMRNTNITKLESYLANVMQAMTKTAEKHDIYVDYLRLVVWLYQFEFFERRYVSEHYSYMIDKKKVYGERHAEMCLTWLIRNEYVSLYKHREAEYYEHEKRFGYTEVKVKKSQDAYRLTDKAFAVLKDYMYFVTNERPKRWGTKNKILVWAGQTRNDFNDYQDF